MDLPRRTKPIRTRRTAAGLGALAALTLATVALSRLKAAPPTVERRSLFIDTVKRGELLRQVAGPGQLVPEQIRWVSAVLSARVDRILLRPGARTTAESVIIELKNPDLELQALEAERQVAGAEAQLASLLATQKSQRLTQESLLATLRSDLGEAERRRDADRALGEKGFLSRLELDQSVGKSESLSGRLSFERERLAALGQGMAAELSAQRAQIDRLRSIAAFRRQEVDALRIRAGVDGVLQELPLQPGQWVSPGTLLAKVAEPSHLKAELRIAEGQAKDVQLGQAVSIDTHSGIIPGKVARIDPAVQAGVVKVEVTLAGALPSGARPDLSIEGTIEIDRLANVLYVGRPAALLGSGTSVQLFKIAPDGREATRVPVELGRSSVKVVEVKSGLREGDAVILSDLSQWDGAVQLRLE